jgi:hypothetical protein
VKSDFLPADPEAKINLVMKIFYIIKDIIKDLTLSSFFVKLKIKMENSLSLKEKFLKIYADLPLGLRQEIIATLKSQGPLTWNSCYIEIINNSPLSNEILIELNELEII